uniref:Uncharacterized protein n=1 Tax=Ditylum brightwellii TaxID=49249 RepID=A0A7S2ELC0_9STRA
MVESAETKEQQQLISGLFFSAGNDGVDTISKSSFRTKKKESGIQSTTTEEPSNRDILEDDKQHDLEEPLIPPSETEDKEVSTADLSDEDDDVNNLEIDSNNEIPTRYSLALHSTTPLLIRILVPLLLLGSHGMFIYGQFEPMWQLNLDTNITDIWFNATTTMTQKAFDQLHKPHEIHIDYHENRVVETFTYGDAINKLWVAAGLPSKTGTRISAVLLILFSGIWPHLKLFVLHLYWWIPRFEKERTTCFFWLSSLGKWSLADVFVVCIMIGVLNLDLVLDPESIKAGLLGELPMAVSYVKKNYTPEKLCETFIHKHCDSKPKFLEKLECKACTTFVNYMYNDPEFMHKEGKNILKGIHTSGSGDGTLRIVGLSGIYLFCVAVLLSLVMGVWIDYYDHKARVYNADKRRSLALSSSSMDGADMMESGQNKSIGEKVRSCCDDMKLLSARLQGSFFSGFSYILLIIFTGGTATIVYHAITEDTMERVVKGAIAKLAHEILDVSWYKPYSLWSLVKVTGAAGGADNLLMSTVAVFLVFGPAVRNGLLIITQIIPMTASAHLFFANTIRALGAFCAWEVFVVAGFMVMLQMPSITNTIIERSECKEVEDDGKCLDVEYNFTKEIWMVVVGGFFLVFASFVTTRIAFSALNPYHDGDLGGPYCCCSCSSLSCKRCNCRRRRVEEGGEVLPLVMSDSPEDNSEQDALLTSEVQQENEQETLE